MTGGLSQESGTDAAGGTAHIISPKQSKLSAGGTISVIRYENKASPRATTIDMPSDNQYSEIVLCTGRTVMQHTWKRGYA